MRVSYLPPSEDDFDRAFSTRVLGGALSDIRVYHPRNNSRGGSFFGVLGSLVKSAYPFLRNIIGSELGNFATNVVRDVSNGSKVRRSMKTNGINALKRTATRIVGGGKRKVKSMKKRKMADKKKKLAKPNCSLPKDVFS